MRELFTRLFSRPGIAAELLVASLFANMLALAMPVFVIQVLNRYVAYGVDQTLATLTAGAAIAVFFEFGFRQARLKLATVVNAPKDEALDTAAFGVLTSAKMAAIDMLPPGLRREIMSGTESVLAAYNAPNVCSVLDVPFALIFVMALALLSPAIALVVACFLVAVFAVAVLSLSSLRGPTREMIAVSGRRNMLVSSAMTAANTVRAFNAAGFLRRLWRTEGDTFRRLRLRITARLGLVQSLTQSSQALMGITVITMGAILVVRGELDVGALIGCNILGMRALGPIAKLATLGEAFAKARQSLDMFKEFSRLPQERQQGSAVDGYKGAVEFKDVAFGYPGSRAPLFESLSLKLEPGSVLVVTGSNGSGKTTLARLLVGLIEPSRGQILVDGVDLAQVVPMWWRRQVAFLPQEPRFFNASLRDNILAFNPELDESGLNQLIDSAGLRPFVSQNPEGFDAMVANNGDNLSLGIRRRLALARALATDGPLAVFDEPTEGLDAEGCAHIYATLNRLAGGGRTIIAFSHDANIVKGTHQVLDLNAKPIPVLSGPKTPAAVMGEVSPAVAAPVVASVDMEPAKAADEAPGKERTADGKKAARGKARS